MAAWLCAKTGVRKQTDWPVGAILSRAASAQNGPHYWLCAEPVHLVVDRDSLFILPRGQLVLSADESLALFNSLAEYFAPERLQMTYIAPHLWCIGHSTPQDLVTTDTDLAIARGVGPCLPSGRDANWWQRQVTAAQMVLHDHPVNAERERRGEVDVNSLWLWGGGMSPVIEKRFDKIVTVDPLLQAIGALTDTEMIASDALLPALIADEAMFVEIPAEEAPALAMSPGGWPPRGGRCGWVHSTRLRWPFPSETASWKHSAIEGRDAASGNARIPCVHCSINGWRRSDFSDDRHSHL